MDACRSGRRWGGVQRAVASPEKQSHGAVGAGVRDGVELLDGVAGWGHVRWAARSVDAGASGRARALNGGAYASGNPSLAQNGALVWVVPWRTLFFLCFYTHFRDELPYR